MDRIDLPDRQSGGHYTAAVRAGGFVFIAGQVPRDAARHIVGDTIEEQTRATLHNVGEVLAAAGARFEDVVKTTVHLQDLDHASCFDEVYKEFFSRGKPVRTLIGGRLNGVLVEIDVIAFVGDDAGHAGAMA